MKLMGILMTLLVVSFFAPQAQAQLTEGYLFGETVGNMQHGVVYQMARASERVVDPLELRSSCIKLDFVLSRTNFIASQVPKDGKNASLKQIFTYSIDGEVNDYVILRVVRKIDFPNNSYATFWFEYIPKEYVRDISELEQLTKAP